MTKRRSIYILILLSIILAVGLTACFVSFTYPLSINGNYYRYSCFVEELVLGNDIADGVTLTYRASLPKEIGEEDYETSLNNTIYGLTEILHDSGYLDNKVTALGEDKIYVEVGNIGSKEDASTIINLIGNPQKLVFSADSTFNEDNADNISGRQYVKSVSVRSQDANVTVYYVDIKFTEQGKQKLADLTSTIAEDSGTLYMYLGDTAIASNTIEEAITNGHLTMYSEDNFVDKKTTQSFVNNIKTGLLDLDLTQIESATITPSFGSRAIFWLSIGACVIVLATFAYLIWKYRTLGLLAVFNLLFFIVIGLGLIQSIPFMHINYSGLLALILGFMMAVISHVIICENAKNEYKTGKKLHTCFKLSQKNSLTPILVISVFSFVLSVICAILPTMGLASFGIVGLVLAIVNTFTSLVWFRLMLKSFVVLTGNNGKLCNFKIEEDKHA